MSAFQCSCGRVHASKDGLQIVGWQECGDGEIALLVNCHCRSTICAEYHDDACLCTRCRQPLTNGARKVVDVEGLRVYCERCATLEGIGIQPVMPAFSEWVKYGSLDTLSNWRMTRRYFMGAP